MSDITALKKYNCPACGAEAVWNPGKKALICPYCGTESPAELEEDGSLIEENDLVAALRELPDDQRGWNAQKRTVRCQNCDAISVFDPERVAQNCDFCGSPALIDIDDIQAPVRPSSLLPCTVSESQVREDVRRWYGSHFWAPGKLGKKALTDTLHGLYLPYWTFDAHAECPWRAESGTYYTTRDSQGRSQRRVRWRPASGHVTHFFDDLLVPASKGVHANLLRKIEPFPTTTDLIPYDSGYLSGWVVELYQTDLVQASQRSESLMNDRLRDMCARAVPGDTHRNLRIDPDYSDKTFKHILLPVWLLTYTYGSKSYQVAVNGVTGKMGGEYPISWVKVTIAVLIGLIILGVLIYANS
jgi:hypothetical protein